MTGTEPVTFVSGSPSGGSAFNDLLQQDTSVFNFIRFHSAGAREEIPAHAVAQLPADLLISLFDGLSCLRRLAAWSSYAPAWLCDSYWTTEAELRKRCVNGAPDKELL